MNLLMEIISPIIQIILALGILNVWFIRAGRTSKYRGRAAANLKDEFTSYGLSSAVFYVVGTLKSVLAVMLLMGLFIPALVRPSAVILALIMVGAVGMHAKVKDPAIRYLPASLMLLMSLLLLL